MPKELRRGQLTCEQVVLLFGLKTLPCLYLAGIEDCRWCVWCRDSKRKLQIRGFHCVWSFHLDIHDKRRWTVDEESFGNTSLTSWVQAQWNKSSSQLQVDMYTDCTQRNQLLTSAMAGLVGWLEVEALHFVSGIEHTLSIYEHSRQVVLKCPATKQRSWLTGDNW